MKKTTMMCDVSQGQQLTLDNGRVVIAVMNKKGTCSRLKIIADADVKIERPQDLPVRLDDVKRGIQNG
jgi:hypothetical protein